MTKDERIAELEEQIEDLKDDVKFLKKKLSEKIEVSILGATEKKYAEIRHEICEKIRNFFDVNPDVVDWDYLNKILNKIEGDE